MTIRTFLITLSLTDSFIPLFTQSVLQSFPVSCRSRWVLPNMWTVHSLWQDYARSNKFTCENQGMCNIIYFWSYFSKDLFQIYPMFKLLSYTGCFQNNPYTLFIKTKYSTWEQTCFELFLMSLLMLHFLLGFRVLSPATIKFAEYIGHWWSSKLFTHDVCIVFYIVMLLLLSIRQLILCAIISPELVLINNNKIRQTFSNYFTERYKFEEVVVIEIKY